MITDFSKIEFNKIMQMSGYSSQVWNLTELSCDKWPNIVIDKIIFHKSFEDECDLLLIKNELDLLGVAKNEVWKQFLGDDLLILVSCYPRVELTMININDMVPITESLNDLIPTFMETVPDYPTIKDLRSDFQCYFPGGIIGRCVLNGELNEGSITAYFEGDFQGKKEILISLTPEKIYQFLPYENKINVLQQKWFGSDLFEDCDASFYVVARDPKSGSIFGILWCWRSREQPKEYKWITKYFKLSPTGDAFDCWLNLV